MGGPGHSAKLGNCCPDVMTECTVTFPYAWHYADYGWDRCCERNRDWEFPKKCLDDWIPCQGGVGCSDYRGLLTDRGSSNGETGGQLAPVVAASPGTTVDVFTYSF